MPCNRVRFTAGRSEGAGAVASPVQCAGAQKVAARREFLPILQARLENRVAMTAGQSTAGQSTPLSALKHLQLLHSTHQLSLPLAFISEVSPHLLADVVLTPSSLICMLFFKEGVVRSPYPAT